MDSEQNQDRWVASRHRMVDEQIRGRGVRDGRVLDAMRRVPRHEFVGSASIGSAHDDTPLGIGDGQTISQPYIVGLMTEMLRTGPADTVLEVGTGSGYQTAVLAEIARTVYTVEIRAGLARTARLTLESFAYSNVCFRIGDGYDGWPDRAPFDGIVVTAAAVSVPPKLVEQLRTGGRMVIPVGDATGGQTLQLVAKESDEAIDIKDTVPVRFVPMISSTGGGVPESTDF